METFIPFVRKCKQIVYFYPDKPQKITKWKLLQQKPVKTRKVKPLTAKNRINP